MKASHIKKKVDALPTVTKIPKRWKNMQATKESRHGKTVWKKNPITVVHTPVAVKVFRQLDGKLKSRMFHRLASEVEFNPKELVTYQPCIAAAAVLGFALDEDLAKTRKKKVLVLGTEEGPCIWNGNHRAVAALLTRRTIHAKYLDLVGGSKKKRS